MERKGKNRLKFLLALLILILCIYYLYANFQWQQIWQVLKGAAYLRLVLLGGLTILIYFLIRSLRWSVLLRVLGHRVSIKDIYPAVAVSLAFSIVTPMQSGEMIKVEMLKKRQDLARILGYGTFAMERMLDLFVVVLFAGYGFIFKLGPQLIGLKIQPLLVALIVLIPLVLLFFLLAFISKDRLNDFKNQCIQLWQEKRKLTLIILLTLTGWLLVVLGWQISLGCISLDLSFDTSIALTGVVTVISIISFIPGALGVSEVSISEILNQLGFELSLAQSGALVLRIFALLYLLIGLLHLLVYRKLKKK